MSSTTNVEASPSEVLEQSTETATSQEPVVGSLRQDPPAGLSPEEYRLRRMEAMTDMMVKRVQEMQTIFVETVEELHTYAEELEGQVGELEKSNEKLLSEVTQLRNELGNISRKE